MSGGLFVPPLTSGFLGWGGSIPSAELEREEEQNWLLMGTVGTGLFGTACVIAKVFYNRITHNRQKQVEASSLKKKGEKGSITVIQAQMASPLSQESSYQGRQVQPSQPEASEDAMDLEEREASASPQSILGEDASSKDVIAVDKGEDKGEETKIGQKKNETLTKVRKISQQALAKSHPTKVNKKAAVTPLAEEGKRGVPSSSLRLRSRPASRVGK